MRPTATRAGPKRAPAKLAAIARASRQVLSANGPRLTQVADVARGAGVASGTVYLYVAEKEALLEIALLSAARFDLPEATTPVTFNAARLRKTTARALQERLTWPLLEAALRHPPQPQTLRAVLEETYDLLRRERELIALLDRCSAEIKVMEQLFIKGARRRFFMEFETCLRRLADAGYVRRDIDLAAASRAAIEMLVWMAMRRPGDPDPPHCNKEAARTASIAFALAGLSRAC